MLCGFVRSALCVFLWREFRPLAPSRRRLFVAPRCPSRALSKTAVSFFLRDVIRGAGAAHPEVGPLSALEIHGVSTSVGFPRTWSVSAVLVSGAWASSSVFSSFICEISSVRRLVSFRWARSWLQVPGSATPHLFLACSGGGGGAMSYGVPAAPRLLGVLPFRLWACPACGIACFGVSLLVTVPCRPSVLGNVSVPLWACASGSRRWVLFARLHICIVFRVHAYVVPHGLVRSGHVPVGVCSPPGVLLTLPGLCLLLTGGQGSLFLGHPAIDPVWRRPGLPRFRIAATPCFRAWLGGR